MKKGETTKGAMTGLSEHTMIKKGGVL